MSRFDREPPTIEALEAAEKALESSVYEWPTDMVHKFAELYRGRNVAAYQLPAARDAYGLLWGALGHLEATELLRALAQKVMNHRQVSSYRGACPTCGYEGAEVYVYDGGWYEVAHHPGSPIGTFNAGEEPLRLPRVCYAGPLPKPKVYQGDFRRPRSPHR